MLLCLQVMEGGRKGKDRTRKEECSGVSKWPFRELRSVCGTLLGSAGVCVCVSVKE